MDKNYFLPPWELNEENQTQTDLWLKLQDVHPEMDFNKIIEMAKNSKYGLVWYSKKGPINIDKDGNIYALY